MTTIKVSYAPEHEVHAHQVTADTAGAAAPARSVARLGLDVVPPGAGRAPGGRLLHPRRSDRRGRRRGGGQAPTRRTARRPLSTDAARRTQAYHRLSTTRHRDEVRRDPPPTHRPGAVAHHPPRRARCLGTRSLARGRTRCADGPHLTRHALSAGSVDGRHLKVISGEGYTGLRSSPVLARKPASRLGRYCIRLTAVC